MYYAKHEPEVLYELTVKSAESLILESNGDGGTAWIDEAEYLPEGNRTDPTNEIRTLNIGGMG